MILTPVNGLPDILVDIDAMKAYANRRGFLHELSIRQPFGKISLVANGKTKELTLCVLSFRPKVTAYLKYTYGLCDERAEMYAEQSEAMLMQRIKEGYATYGFLHFLKKNASRMFRADRCRRIEYYENGKPKPINANYM